MFGEHNARNAISAALAAKQYGISLKDSLSSLEKFQGVSKRQDIILDTGPRGYEDTAHRNSYQNNPTSSEEEISKKRLLAAIELRSNTMKSGFHDEQLLHSVCNDLIFGKLILNKLKELLIEESIKVF